VPDQLPTEIEGLPDAARATTLELSGGDELELEIAPVRKRIGDATVRRTGETVDILLDVTNPGLWMAHCHIAEHHESGMMFSFKVAP
jgi:FtsP/CotA-like multicopper oxidase with cupredoxin domain